MNRNVWQYEFKMRRYYILHIQRSVDGRHPLRRVHPISIQSESKAHSTPCPPHDLPPRSSPLLSSRALVEHGLVLDRTTHEVGEDF